MGYNAKRMARLQRLREKRSREEKRKQAEKEKVTKSVKKKSKITPETKERRRQKKVKVHREGGLPVEQEVLGKPLTILDPKNPPTYLPFKEALIEALSFAEKSPWSANNPNTPIARSLHNTVHQALVNDIGEIPKYSIGLWPTHGTAFDYWHGVDAIFLFESRWYVTLDISTTEKSRFKADFLVLPEKFQDRTYITDLSRRISALLQTKKALKQNMKPLL